MFLPSATSGYFVDDVEDFNGAAGGTGDSSGAITNSIVVGTGASIGYNNSTIDTLTGAWTISNSGLTGGGTFSSGVAVNDQFTANPGFGSCYLWAPDGSNAQEAGVGATVLYAYQNGVLTNTKLWNSNGSPAFAGAVVAGSLNDPAVNPGKTLSDLGKRLNINQNGCSFPAGY